MTENFKDKQIDFQFDDISDDLTFVGCDDFITEEFMTNLMEKIRGCDWFIEGNKTEGTITFHSDIMFSVGWVVKTISEEGLIDEENDYSQDVILNIDDTQYKVINW